MTDDQATPVAEALTEARIPYTHKVVPLATLHANPWNPNKMDDRTRQAARESIATFGFIDPITVRAHPELDGHYQIIDGEHRWTEATELGYTDAPVIVLDVDDPTAMKLTIVFNETRGEADAVLLGGVLKQLHDDLGDDARIALRYDDGEIKHLLDLANHTDWDQYNQGGGNGGGGDGDDQWTTVQLRVPHDFMDVWQEAIDAVTRRNTDLTLHEDEKVAAGQVAEVLAAAYLSGPEHPDT